MGEPIAPGAFLDTQWTFRFYQKFAAPSLRSVVAYSFLLALFSGTWIPPLRSQGRATNGDRESTRKRLVTVADTIRMTQFGDDGYLNGLLANDNVAKFSPDGMKFIVLLRKGNIDLNLNEYWLVMYLLREPLQIGPPQILARLSSSSNRPAIEDVRWKDNRSLTFLGENPGELHQLYTLDCYTKHLEKLTDHSTNLVSYAITGSSGDIVYTAEKPTEALLTDRAKREGIAVEGQRLTDLIRGEVLPSAGASQDLVLKDRLTKSERRVNVPGVLGRSDHLWLAPNGRYLVVMTRVTNYPESWKDYHDVHLQKDIQEKHIGTAPHSVFQYTLVEIESGQSQPLVDAPIGRGHTDILWSPDSKFVIVAGTFLPLDVAEPSERRIRNSSRFVAEIRIPGRDVVPITHDELKLRRWDARTNSVLFESTKYGTADLGGKLVAYKQVSGTWHRVDVVGSGLDQGDQIEVTLEEDMNTPPRLFAKNLKSGEKKVLLDLNPDFETIAFGRVEEVSFKATDGHEVRGGLFRPPNFQAGRRYPLVIQTHGWNPKRFWIDGPYATAFAAQPLAAKEFVVLQLEEDLSKTSTPEEPKEEMTAYEGAIDYLDSISLIDRNRVGIIAFSRTGLGVKYTLMHSAYHFGAAIIAEGQDEGYFKYIAYLSSDPETAADAENINGSVPFGPGLRSWLTNSSDFGLNIVSTPVLLEANSYRTLFYAWEWFVGLFRLGKPVDFIYMPDGAHILVKPWNRMTSQQSTVDWFCFWLKHEEVLTRQRRRSTRAGVNYESCKKATSAPRTNPQRQ